MKPDIAFHITVPFCTKGHSTPTASYVPIARRKAYFAALEREIAQAEDIFSEYAVRNLSFKGGDAGVQPDKAAQVLTAFRAACGAADLWTQICISPASATEPNLGVLCTTGGFDRLVLDAPAVQEALLAPSGAAYTAMQLRDAFTYLVLFDLQDVSLNTLYGLPGQSTTLLLDSLKRFLEFFSLRHITLSPFWATPLDAAGMEAQFTEAAALLAGYGFQLYAANAFAKQGAASPALLHKCRGGAIAGLGLGAQSEMDGYITGNTWDLDTYIAGDGDYEKIVASVRAYDEKEAVLRRFACSMHLAEGIPLQSAPLDLAEKLEIQGLAKQEAGRLRPSIRALMDADSILKALSI